MIKKLFLVIAFLGVGLFTPLMAREEISMQVILKGASGSGPTYAPPRPWYITQDGYVLTMPAFEDDYTLELRDENDVLVYTDYVPAGTTQVVLPSTLSGDFELRLVADTYYYIGYINL